MGAVSEMGGIQRGEEAGSMRNRPVIVQQTNVQNCDCCGCGGCAWLIVIVTVLGAIAGLISG